MENLQPALKPRERAEVAAAIAETDRLAHLVDGLLTLARSDAQQVEPHVVDVGDVISDRVALWTPQAAGKGVTLTAGPEVSGSVLAVPGALQQILDHYIANALNASPTDGIITITSHRTPTHLTLHVIDQGPGLGPDDQERAFDRFWRAPGNRAKGSGLGLAIVAELAVASHGKAALTNGPHGGLDAAVRLPLASTSNAPEPPTTAEPPPEESLTLR